MKRKQRAAEHGRPGAYLRVQRRDQEQHDHEDRNEHTHRPFLGGYFDIQVGNAQKPHECRNCGSRPDQGGVADLDRLHANQKCMGQEPGPENGRGEAARPGVAPGKVRDIGGRGGGVQDERQQMHGSLYWLVGP